MRLWWALLAVLVVVLHGVFLADTAYRHRLATAEQQQLQKAQQRLENEHAHWQLALSYFESLAYIERAARDAGMAAPADIRTIRAPSANASHLD